MTGSVDVASVDVASQVLDLVRAQLGPQAQAEVAVHRAESALTRFANSFIHQNVADCAVAVSLRLHLGGRTAGASTSRTDDEGLRALVARAAAAAKLLPADPLWPGLAPPAQPASGGIVDEATAAAEPADRAQRVRAFVAAAEGLGAAGYCRTAYVRAVFANTAGQVVSGAYTEASFDGVARGGDGADGMARRSSSRLADLDGAVLGARAVAKARVAAPTYLPPGEYEVVLEPAAAADLLEGFSYYGFNAKAVLERRSFAAVGAAQFDSGLSIVDDPTGPFGLGLRYDSEGTPKRRLELVRAGVITAVTHDRRTAREAGTQSTGHAVVGGETLGAIAQHLTVEAAGPGTGGAAPPVGEVAGPAADSEVAGLVAGVRRGLLISDFWYTRVLDPRPMVVTGLTRNGLWLIEDGEVAGAVRNLRFTQAYPEALGPGRVLGIGATAATQPGSWGFSAFRAPALRLASWKFTGGAEG